jgi:hypothetical protein
MLAVVIVFLGCLFSMVFGIGVRDSFPVRAVARLIAAVAAPTQVYARDCQHNNRRDAGRDNFAFAQIDVHIGCFIS